MINLREPTRENLNEICEIIHQVVVDWCEGGKIPMEYVPDIIQLAHADAVIIRTNTKFEA